MQGKQNQQWSLMVSGIKEVKATRRSRC